ncbi:hypothetical protein M427DRAFT_42543 [Gonapodya prolifera JEL478]|uniref:Uncharacterized protein n=1 Tax=Gonapodya prolifera (strain JEL478) TaxID=1344416 RepID=A0A139AP62_GONPJ|nr:hypothetical protein M427DRAFT_42543 [Gonapodya prolifera JEL478]|eukprot:KXS18539.1 hypothetical protein M427DRAFT_42543 [Gonapodya prolifera JEL478]
MSNSESGLDSVSGTDKKASKSRQKGPRATWNAAMDRTLLEAYAWQKANSGFKGTAVEEVAKVVQDTHKLQAEWKLVTRLKSSVDGAGMTRSADFWTCQRTSGMLRLRYSMVTQRLARTPSLSDSVQQALERLKDGRKRKRTSMELKLLDVSGDKDNDTGERE